MTRTKAKTLPKTIKPIKYSINLTPNLNNFSFDFCVFSRKSQNLGQLEKTWKEGRNAKRKAGKEYSVTRVETTIV